MRRHYGFTLTELAVVMVIVGLLFTTAMYTFSAQFEQRNRNETQRKLEETKELLLSFALVNGRLPCPGVATGDEAGGDTTDCTNYYGGFLPARTIGYQPVDSSGFGLDAWGNRIRYAVSSTRWPTSILTNNCASRACFTKTHVPNNAAKAWSLAQTPADLQVCSAALVSATACDAGAVVTNQNVVVAIVFSTGPNSATGGTGLNESRNLDGNALYVYRPPDPNGAAGGEFDDMMVWIPVGQLYGRMIAGSVLP